MYFARWVVDDRIDNTRNDNDESRLCRFGQKLPRGSTCNSDQLEATRNSTDFVSAKLGENGYRAQGCLQCLHVVDVTSRSKHPASRAVNIGTNQGCTLSRNGGREVWPTRTWAPNM